MLISLYSLIYFGYISNEHSRDFILLNADILQILKHEYHAESHKYPEYMSANKIVYSLSFLFTKETETAADFQLQKINFASNSLHLVDRRKNGAFHVSFFGKSLFFPHTGATRGAK